MAYFVKTEIEARTVAVGVVQQAILAPQAFVGEDSMLVIIENLSATETFDGVAYSAPTSTGPWTAEANDEFQSIAPLTSRRMLLPSDRLYGRVLGNFQAAPGSIKLTVIFFRKAIRRA